MNINFKSSYNEPQACSTVSGGFSAKELEKIYLGLSNVQFNEAKTLDTVDSDQIRRDVRSSRIKWIPRNQEWEWLYERLMAMIEESNNGLWRFNIVCAPEMIQYTEYLDSDGGHYTWHQDIGPGRPSHRKISVTVQLSDPDEYEGGDLEIWSGGSSIFKAPKEAGLAVIFPSYMMHRVTPVIRGRRCSLVLWVGGSHYS